MAESPYLGDPHLEHLLREAGVDRPAKEVRALVAGVAAAPEPRDPGLWLDLVTERRHTDLDAQLLALRAELARDWAEPGTDPDRIALLRAELRSRGLDGFVVPLADAHQGEYVPRRAMRLAWLTGFTGSAGVAAVLLDRAAIFVDGRYTVQVKSEVDTRLIDPIHIADERLERWIARSLRAGMRLGFDPWLHTPEGVERLQEACTEAKAVMVPCETNPVDAIWTDQPPAPLAPVEPHPTAYSGRSSSDKRSALATGLASAGVDAAVITQPDAIAWLLNIRGGDVPRTPLPLSFALLRRDGSVDLFIDPRKLLPTVPAHLGPEVRLRAPSALGAVLDQLGAEGRSVRVDPATATAWILRRLEGAGARVARGPDPTALPRARKNPVELRGARAAHRRDGAALCRFLAWLDARARSEGAVTELQAADHLAGLRREQDLFRDLSFDTISGAGPHGAIVHYRVSPATDRRLSPGDLYLVDSGGQYLDGTTDVTRTVAIGPPSAEQRDRFTRVLRGHIAVAVARFPAGTSGSELDPLARAPLWEAGLDYDHGTGHGVGSYLGVHEGPQRIARRSNSVPLEPGMIVSNEPGYYLEGAYGIRIENLLVVVDDPRPEDARPTLAFETLTLAPIDRRLVETGGMSPPEIAWLNAYHARVRDEITALVDDATARWLHEATAPLERTPPRGGSA